MLNILEKLLIAEVCVCTKEEKGVGACADVGEGGRGREGEREWGGGREQESERAREREQKREREKERERQRERKRERKRETERDRETQRDAGTSFSYSVWMQNILEKLLSLRYVYVRNRREEREPAPVWERGGGGGRGGGGRGGRGGG